jgi:hypothetical protein
MTALVAGVLYLVTFIAGIPPSFLYEPVFSNPDYIVTAADADTQVALGAFLDFVTAMAGIGTAVALYWIVKRENQGFALGFVTTRLVEAAVIITAAVSMLTITTLRQPDATGTDASALVAIQEMLVAVRNWTHLIGPGLMPAFNAVLLGTLMYRSGLVPRIIPILGLIGAPLLLSSSIGTMFGVNDSMSVWTGIATIPIFFWELSLGLYMTFKGFRTDAPILARNAESGG